ncbi:MAG: hypothetical protein BWY85_02235 [Firmicutes bacterium ADurb.Bin506]|nr:MAG: hypothetical protein BWY85_02235 [Firmicutes bacterium ADurb.Bin506]
MPVVANTVGMSRRAAAMSIAGTTLSQAAIITMPSKKPWLRIMISTLSAMTSRDARGYLIPSCPCAMPSHTAMVPNSSGTPPAAKTPLFTAAAMSRMPTWPGTISFHEFTTAMTGRSRAS